MEACRVPPGPWADSDVAHWASPRLLLRVHVEVDAANGCFDHVVFTHGGPAGRPCTLDGYVGLYRPRVRVLADARDVQAWVQRVAGLRHVRDAAILTRQWRRLFPCPRMPLRARPWFRGPIADVNVHVSHWYVVKPLAAELPHPLHFSVHSVPGLAAGPSPSCRPPSEVDLG